MYKSNLIKHKINSLHFIFLQHWPQQMSAFVLIKLPGGKEKSHGKCETASSVSCSTTENGVSRNTCFLLYLFCFYNTGLALCISLHTRIVVLKTEAGLSRSNCTVCVLLRLCSFILICFVCTGVRASDSEWQLNCS
jgi:hypothetical protein